MSCIIKYKGQSIPEVMQKGDKIKNSIIKQTPNKVNQFLFNLSGKWNEHKPALMKHFPITDFSIGPFLDYVSGKSDIAPILPTTSAKWIPTKGNYYRIVGKEALEDAQKSGLVRTNYKSKPSPLDRPTRWPSFSKDSPSMEYAEKLSSEGTPHIIYETSRPMKASTMGRHGKGSTQFPVDSEGKFIDQFPANEVNVLYPNKYLGYSKYPQFQNGGILKFQKGSWLKKRMSETIDPTVDINLGQAITQIGNLTFNNKSKVKDPVATAAWNKYLGVPYDTNSLLSNNDGTFRLPDNVANQIETDTTSIKNQIKNYQNIVNQNPNSDAGINAKGNIPFLNNYLEKLRKMYKGDHVTVNEYEARKGAFDEHGYMNTDDTPLNVLHKFALKYNPQTKEKGYYDTYDFNKIDFMIPGNKFEIKGVIPKKQQGGILKAQTGSKDWSKIPLEDTNKKSWLKSNSNNWAQRFNNKVYTGYQNIKPQLFKDFPILDIGEPIVKYITGKGNEEESLAMIPALSKTTMEQISKAPKIFNDAGEWEGWYNKFAENVTPTELTKAIQNKYGVETEKLSDFFRGKTIEEYVNKANAVYDALKSYSNNFRGWITSSERAALPRNVSNHVQQDVTRLFGKDPNLSEDVFRKTVTKATGELVPLPSLRFKKPDVTNISMQEYLDGLNSHLHLLDNIIGKYNKTGIPYRVKEFTSGQIKFSSPLGVSTWGVKTTPGLWRGTIQDIPHKNYYDRIPGINIESSVESVFGDFIPRRGSGAYKSLNEYLKFLDSGRVKSGMNSQSDAAFSLWSNAIKDTKAVGYFMNPKLIGGIFKTILPASIGEAVIKSNLKNNNLK